MAICALQEAGMVKNFRLPRNQNDERDEDETDLVIATHEVQTARVRK
jgi:hypothetical protein